MMHIITLISFTTQLSWLYVEGAGLSPMQCNIDTSYVNSMDGYHNNVKTDRFLSGQHSNHENYYEDREFKWRYCRPRPSDSPYYPAVAESQALPQTSYDETWFRSCAIINNGNAAMIGAVSTHHNYYEDRLWTWHCGALASRFRLTNCVWSGVVNAMDADVNYDCANQGIIRSIRSNHHNYYEDRQWQFECCRVYDAECNNCARAAEEDIADNGELDTINSGETVNKNAWEKLSSSERIGLVCGIVAVVFLFVVLGSAWYFRYKKATFVELDMDDRDQEAEDEEENSIDEGAELNREEVETHIVTPDMPTSTIIG